MRAQRNAVTEVERAEHANTEPWWRTGSCPQRWQSMLVHHWGGEVRCRRRTWLASLQGVVTRRQNAWLKPWAQSGRMKKMAREERAQGEGETLLGCSSHFNPVVPVRDVNALPRIVPPLHGTMLIVLVPMCKVDAYTRVVPLLLGAMFLAIVPM